MCSTTIAPESLVTAGTDLWSNGRSRPFSRAELFARVWQRQYQARCRQCRGSDPEDGSVHFLWCPLPVRRTYPS